MGAGVEQAAPDELGVVVPACPAWTASDLLRHVVSLPAAMGAGDHPAPGASIGDWMQGLIDARHGVPVPELVEEWLGLDEVIVTALDGRAGVMFGDLAVHEHDLRGALGATDHAALEVDVMLPRTLAGFSRPLRAAGLGSIEVRSGDRARRSHDAEPGWTLVVAPREAVRAVNSRRTPDELRTLDHEGDVEVYLPVLDAHLPLPSASLGER